MAANSKGIKNWPCLIRMLLFHPITRDYGFHPPLGSFDASLGPMALEKPQNSLGVDKTHYPLWWVGTISHYLPGKWALSWSLAPHLLVNNEFLNYHYSPVHGNYTALCSHIESALLCMNDKCASLMCLHFWRMQSAISIFFCFSSSFAQGKRHSWSESFLHYFWKTQGWKNSS